MRKPLPAPVRPARPEAIGPTLDRLTSEARFYAFLGDVTPEDQEGIIKRTASLCGVSIDSVKEAIDG